MQKQYVHHGERARTNENSLSCQKWERESYFFSFNLELYEDWYDVYVKQNTCCYGKLVVFFALLSFYSLIAYTEQYVEYDPLITPAEPSNPWISDDIALWDIEMR